MQPVSVTPVCEAAARELHARSLYVLGPSGQYRLRSRDSRLLASSSVVAEMTQRHETEGRTGERFEGDLC